MREFEHAADLLALGLDGWQYLATSDPVERLAFMALAPRAAERRRDERKALAAEIVNALGKAMN